MDVLREMQLAIVQILRNVEEEDCLIEELLEDNDDLVMEGDFAQGEVRGRFEDVLALVLNEILRLKMLELAAVDDANVIDLICARGEMFFDWRAGLPRMEYMRHLEDPSFQRHFRMDRETFEELIVVLGNHLTATGRLIRLRTELDKCLLMGLWIMFNLDTFRSAGIIFGVSKGIVHFHYLIVIEALRELAPKYIKWPSALERVRNERIVQERTGFPGFVGALDGILFRCYAPTIQRERYFDRHQAYSINVQGVCDQNMLYRNIYVGEPGSVHDTRAFQRSPLYNHLLEGQDLVRDGERILADGGYECMTKVLTPFRDLGRMTPRQRRYNYKHSSVRMVVERSFGKLRSICRRLLKLHILRFAYLIDHLVASFVILNFINLRGREADGICIMNIDQNLDPRNFEENDGDNVEDEGFQNHNEVAARQRHFEHPLLRQAKAAGIRKREDIADVLHHD